MSDEIIELMAQKITRLSRELEETRRQLAEATGASGGRVALTVNQMAKRANVSRSQIYRWIQTGVLRDVIFRTPSGRAEGDGEIRCWSTDFDAAIRAATASPKKKRGGAR